MDSTSYDSFGEVRTLVGDLFRVRAVLYWIDFIVTMSLAWTSFWMAFKTPWSMLSEKTFWLLLSAFAFFRALVFTHEIIHIRRADLPGFRWAWNAFCGMVFFLPDYTYIAHAYHHRTATFSTKEDPEYVPVACQRPLEILAPFLIFPFVPFLLTARGLILGPLSLMVGGRFRQWVLRHASTLKMNPRFEWKDISEQDRRLAALEDGLCAMEWIFLAVGGYFLGGFRIFLQWYLVAYLILTINHIRSLARHRYANGSGNPMTYENQILDSITITGFSPLTWIFMPVGLRYHSVHHMFPMLPYHTLPEAHARLKQALPENHLYFKTIVPSFSIALLNLLKATRIA